MRKNGFTLIELLAVIVILAIIALIATPIILGIINDAREKANERSVELYAAAVKNGIAAYQLTGLNAPKSFSDLTIQYDGDVKCSVQELYEDGSFYLEGCKVNNGTKEYSYGTKQETPYVQVYKPQYYYFEFEFEGIVGSTTSPAGLLTEPPKGEERYLGFDVENGVVSTAYVCFVIKETEYCLKGNASEAKTNAKIIKDAFETNADAIIDEYTIVIDDYEYYCSFEDSSSRCEMMDPPSGYTVSAGSNGIFVQSGSADYCETNTDGSFGCYYY